MKILITIGHGIKNGRYDPGACANGYEEFKLVREIGKFTQQHLNNNYDVQCDLWNYDGKMSLVERIKNLKDNTYKYVAEIHLNAGGGTGTEVYAYSIEDKGFIIAGEICNSLQNGFGFKNRGAKVSGGNYGIVDRTRPTANLVEVCFIDTLQDVQKVATTNGQLKAGQLIGDGIAKGLGLLRKEQQTPIKPPQPQTQPQHLKGTVICSALNMRQKPMGKIIRVLKNGEYFTILSAKDGWFYIDFAGIKGYVAVDDNYVKVQDLNNGNKIIKYGTPITG